MKKTVRRGIEALRSPKPCYSRGRDEIYRKLTALTARKSGIEVQLKSYKDRINTLNEILQKIRKEEVTLANLLKPNINFPSGEGGDKKQSTLPETMGPRGKEMVFRF